MPKIIEWILEMRLLCVIMRLIFFGGFYFSKKLTIKNLKIKTRIIKSVVEEEIPSGTK